MRRPLLLPAALAVTLATVTIAPAGPSAYIDASEEVKPTPGSPTTDDSHRLDGASRLTHNYPVSLAPDNSIAYVDPATLRMGALAVAETRYDLSGAAPLPDYGWRTDRPGVDLDLGYDTQLVIGAGTSGKNTGDPVRLTLTLRIDGSISTGHFHYDQPASSWADVWIDLELVDRSRRIDYGEGYSYETPVSFSLDASMVKESWRGWYYDPDGGWSLDTELSWDLVTNASPAQSFDVDDYVEGESFPGPVAVPAPFYPGPDTLIVDTGTLTAAFDTYVGSSLDLSASMSFLMQSRGGSPYAKADFLNTFALHLAPAAGFEGLDLSVTGLPLVPEPAAPVLVACLVLGTAICRHRSRIGK